MGAFPMPLRRRKMKKTYGRHPEGELDIKVGEEFESLVLRAKAGDKSASWDIVERLSPLVKSSIRRYYNNYKEQEDLIQEGNLMILECIGDYSPGQGFYFLGYVKSCLKFMYLDKHKTRVHLSLNLPIGDEMGEQIDLLLSDDKDIASTIVEGEGAELLKRALSLLTKRQREVIRLYYIEELTMVEIGNLLNVNYRTVVNTKVRAMAKLKKELLDMNYN